MSNVIIINGNKSSGFNLITYPDKQRTVKINLDILNVKKSVSIKCSIKCFDELEILSCVIAALRRNDFFVEVIKFIYLFGMRSDRAFSKEEPNYFRDVVSPIINSYKISRIEIFEPHSNLSLYAINNSYRWFFSPGKIESLFGYSFLIIGGDQSTYAPLLTLNYSFNKKREAKIIQVELNQEALDECLHESNNRRPIIIVDDLCDAGGTFIAESKYLRSKGVKKPLWLYVHHGLFTQGVEPLLEHFDKIICTNSYQDIIHSHVEQIRVI